MRKVSGGSFRPLLKIQFRSSQPNLPSKARRLLLVIEDSNSQYSRPESPALHRHPLSNAYHLQWPALNLHYAAHRLLLVASACDLVDNKPSSDVLNKPPSTISGHYAARAAHYHQDALLIGASMQWPVTLVLPILQSITSHHEVRTQSSPEPGA